MPEQILLDPGAVVGGPSNEIDRWKPRLHEKRQQPVCEQRPGVDEALGGNVYDPAP
jgi:hypothetical protein